MVKISRKMYLKLSSVGDCARQCFSIRTHSSCDQREEANNVKPNKFQRKLICLRKCLLRLSLNFLINYTCSCLYVTGKFLNKNSLCSLDSTTCRHVNYAFESRGKHSMKRVSVSFALVLKLLVVCTFFI